MTWIFLMLASVGEIIGVTCINLYIQQKKIFWLFGIVLAMGLGFFCLSIAMNEIDLGTAYAIWTGLGAAGAVLIGIIFFKESAGWKRLFFLTCIISGAVGLKFLS